MFPSIGDIEDSISSLFSSDAVKKGLSAAGQSLQSGTGSGSSSAVNQSYSLSAVDRGQMSLSAISAEAKKAQMQESADPYKIEQMWTDRLSTWAKINRDQGQSFK